ncbi:MAG: hypothetical protein ACJ788_23075 [Ktedonobacteraceae bacterium]
MAWSPDSTRIASASWDKTVQVWNASDGECLYLPWSFLDCGGCSFEMLWSSFYSSSV